MKSVRDRQIPYNLSYTRTLKNNNKKPRFIDTQNTDWGSPTVGDGEWVTRVEVIEGTNVQLQRSPADVMDSTDNS